MPPAPWLLAVGGSRGCGQYARSPRAKTHSKPAPGPGRVRPLETANETRDLLAKPWHVGKHTFAEDQADDGRTSTCSPPNVDAARSHVMLATLVHDPPTHLFQLLNLQADNAATHGERALLPRCLRGGNVPGRPKPSRVDEVPQDHTIAGPPGKAMGGQFLHNLEHAPALQEQADVPARPLQLAMSADLKELRPLGTRMTPYAAELPEDQENGRPLIPPIHVRPLAQQQLCYAHGGRELARQSATRAARATFPAYPHIEHPPSSGQTRSSARPTVLRQNSAVSHPQCC
jgi:hypothetical protein